MGRRATDAEIFRETLRENSDKTGPPWTEAEREN